MIRAIRIYDNTEETIMKLLNLNGIWNIKSKEEEYNLQGDAPGSLFYTLEQSGYFGEEGLFFRENNRVCIDIADRDYSYSREFGIWTIFALKYFSIILTSLLALVRISKCF